MSFNSENKVKEIALSNPAARQVLEGTGADHCCGGEKSLHQACLHADVPPEEILKRLQENSKHVKAGEENWTSAPLSDLTNHIRERHHRYVRDFIARVQPLLAKVIAKWGNNHAELAEIQNFFGEVSREMTMHMRKEEQVLFPYIEAVERAAGGNGSVEPPFFQTVRNPIQAMMREHDDAGELVRQIRAASSEYAAPADACTSYKALYQELREFEADLRQHVHLENDILFPRAVEMEATVA